MSVTLDVPVWLLAVWTVVCLGAVPFANWSYHRSERRERARHEARLSAERRRRPSVRLVIDNEPLRKALDDIRRRSP